MCSHDTINTFGWQTWTLNEKVKCDTTTRAQQKEETHKSWLGDSEWNGTVLWNAAVCFIPWDSTQVNKVSDSASPWMQNVSTRTGTINSNHLPIAHFYYRCVLVCSSRSVSHSHLLCLALSFSGRRRHCCGKMWIRSSLIAHRCNVYV